MRPNSKYMEELEDAFEVGKEVLQERYGDFEEEPKDFTLEDGLMENSMAAHTRSRVPMKENGSRLVIYSQNAKPQEITIDEDLAEQHPTKAAKSLLHELFEWRAAEEMVSDDVLASRTHYIAEFNENALCRDVNEEIGEEVCDAGWNNDYQT